MDATDRRVKKQIGEAVAYAYGFHATVDPPDPELCACQRERPEQGTDRCVYCREAS